MNNEGIYASLLKELRFKIGEQYEINEFNLKSVESTFINGLEYENYEYIKGDFKTLFGVQLLNNIIIQYNGDILSGMIYSLDLSDLDSLVETLNDCLSFSEKLDIDKLYLGQTINICIAEGISIKLDIEELVSLRVFRTLGQT